MNKKPKEIKELTDAEKAANEVSGGFKTTRVELGRGGLTAKEELDNRTKETKVVENVQNDQ